MRILLAEDDISLAQILLECLRKTVYGVDAVYTVEEALEYAQSGIYDIAVIAAFFSKGDGVSLVKTLRDGGNILPILLFAENASTEDVVCGLDAGADDYMRYPFNADEFLARIRALGRRKGEVRKALISFGDLTLNKNTCELKNATGSSVRLTLKEFQIMELLLENSEQIIKKERIIEKIWGGDSEAEYNNVEVYISFLRKKMQRLGIQTRIATARSIGYYLNKKEGI